MNESNVYMKPHMKQHYFWINEEICFNKLFHEMHDPKLLAQPINFTTEFGSYPLICMRPFTCYMLLHSSWRRENFDLIQQIKIMPLVKFDVPFFCCVLSMLHVCCANCILSHEKLSAWTLCVCIFYQKLSSLLGRIKKK